MPRLLPPYSQTRSTTIRRFHRSAAASNTSPSVLRLRCSNPVLPIVRLVRRTQSHLPTLYPLHSSLRQTGRSSSTNSSVISSLRLHSYPQPIPYCLPRSGQSAVSSVRSTLRNCHRTCTIPTTSRHHSPGFVFTFWVITYAPNNMSTFARCCGDQISHILSDVHDAESLVTVGLSIFKLCPNDRD